MSGEQALAFVRASAALLRIPMDPARATRVAQHFARSATMAAQLDAAGLREDDEPDELYCPAPFPAPAAAA